jgi:hypothetical protein
MTRIQHYLVVRKQKKEEKKKIDLWPEYDALCSRERMGRDLTPREPSQ